MESLGKLLQKRRLELGFTLRDIEKITSISNAYLSQLEHDKISQPSPTILQKLSKNLELSYSKLLTLAGHPVDLTVKPLVQFRISSEFETLSSKEERELLDYLRFIRNRRKTR